MTTTEIMNLADTYADGPHTEGYYGAHRAALLTAIEALVRDAEKAKEALRDAFTEGYFARSTYNDVETSNCDTEWHKYIAAQEMNHG